MSTADRTERVVSRRARARLGQGRLEVEVTAFPDEVGSNLVDLTSTNLDEVGALDNPVLASILQALRREAEHPEEAVAGFNASL